ncbi:MAG: TIGR04372 family glycosyltransferase [Deltaproteobacteria bacterium]|nr:TIGR04372 family glycosyltransferase [Deltaproteobacteria bacterium]
MMIRKYIFFIARKALIPFAWIFIGLEYSLFVIRHLQKIQKSEFVNSTWFWSFGHQATDPHMLAMRFKDKRLLVLVSDYQKFNQLIVESFEPILDIVYLNHSFISKLIFKKQILTVIQISSIIHLVLESTLRLLGRAKEQNIRDFHEYRRPQIEALYATEYIDLMQSSKALFPKANLQKIQKIRDKIEKQKPEIINRWIVSIYLRKKFESSWDVRDVDQQAFCPLVKKIYESGGIVFLGAESDANIFKSFAPTLHYSDFNISRDELDYFFITQPQVFVCSHSGPLAIAAAFQVPSLITNVAFFHASGFIENQITLFKSAYWKASGKKLSPQELFSFPVVEFSNSVQFERAGIKLIDNTEEEILSAFDQCSTEFMKKQPSQNPLYSKLLDEFYRLQPANSFAKKSPSRPAFFQLENMLKLDSKTLD